MTGWLRRGAAALAVASDRGELWPAGTLASLVYLGWLPLLAVVAPPDAGDLAFFGVSLIASGAYPANVVALAVAAVAGLLLLYLLAVTAEAALLQAMAPGREPARPRLTGALAVARVASLPAAAAAGALALAIAGQAAGAFTSPDVDTPILLRLVLAVLPFVIILLLAVLLGLVVGAIALRRLLGGEAAGFGAALGGAFRQLRRAPAGPAGVAVVGWLKDLLLLAVAYALLRVLWAPIGGLLGPGLPGSPEALLLLVGFVAIWLALLLAGGALHVALSAWWLAELTEAGASGRRVEMLEGGADADHT